MPDEVIVVDNNSTDNTAAIVRAYPFAKLLREKRPGLRFTRNTGMDAATSDVIGRIDADVLLSPTWCEEAKEIFANADIYAATGPCYYYDMPSPKLGLRVDRLARRLSFGVGSPLLYGSNMAVRRDAWQGIRDAVCMQGEFFEDYDISIHLQESGYKIAYDPKLIVGVAARILDSTARNFYRTMQFHTRTFELHGKRSVSASINKYMLLGGYPIFRLIRDVHELDVIPLSRTRLRRKRARRPTSNT